MTEGHDAVHTSDDAHENRRRFVSMLDAATLRPR
jgi:hypothetical protein